MYNIKSKTILTIIIFTALMGSSGCGSKALEMSSKWCDREIIIDGKNLEWDGGITYIDDPNVAIGQFNDGEYLYLQLSSWDTEIVKHVMGSGITVWFDPEAGEEKIIGIHYPIGRGSKGLPAGAELERSEMDKRPEMLSMMDSQMQRLEILAGEDKEPMSMPIAEAKELGIEVSIGFNKRTLVYEMKMPLVRDADHPFGIGANPLGLSKEEERKIIGVGIETPEMDMPEFSERMAGPPGGGEEMVGDMSGGPGGAPPSGGGRPGGGPGSRAEPEAFSIWLLLSLSPQP